MRLSQKAYIEKVLKRSNMENCSSIVTPIVKGEKISLNQCPQTTLEQEGMKRIPYASAIGSLMYVQVSTRPDIAFVVGMQGRHQKDSSMEHWKALKKVMR